MSYDLFARIMERAAAGSWRCILLAGRQGLPPHYRRACEAVAAQMFLPVAFADAPALEKTTLVVHSDELQRIPGHLHAYRAVLRVRRTDLSDLFRTATDLLAVCPDLSLRHPELLNYDDNDLAAYRRELMRVGRWLLDQGQAWQRYRLDCLTDRLRNTLENHCGAGDTKLAVGPGGQVCLCPAALRGGGVSYGQVLEEITIPNRQLFTKDYSVPCLACDALHCFRCVYLNKRATLEYCVPPRVACRLAHAELAVQAWLAEEAIRTGLWEAGGNAPETPTLDDPCERIKKAWAPSVHHTWHSLIRLGGRADGLNPAVMLFIINGLHGWCRTLAACAEASCVPSPDQARDPLFQIRRRTIERYKDTVFTGGGPTVGEVESAMWRAFTSSVTSQEVRGEESLTRENSPSSGPLERSGKHPG
jgi:CXXX repeat peptide maturase